MMAKAKKALPSSRSLILTRPHKKKTWGNPQKIWRKNYFVQKV
jgi:hypothetical protein